MNFISRNVNSIMRIILPILVILLIIFICPVVIGGIIFVCACKFIINLINKFKRRKFEFNRYKSKNTHDTNDNEFCPNRVIDVKYKEV